MGGSGAEAGSAAGMASVSASFDVRLGLRTQDAASDGRGWRCAMVKPGSWEPWWWGRLLEVRGLEPSPPTLSMMSVHRWRRRGDLRFLVVGLGEISV